MKHICSDLNNLSVERRRCPQPSYKTSPDTTYGKIYSSAMRIVLEDVKRELNLAKKEVPQDAEPSAQEIEECIHSAAARHGFELSPFEKDEILISIEKEKKPFGILQPLVEDPSVSDIIITNYEKVSVQQGRRNYSTDLRFPSHSAYEAFVERILTKAGTSYSTKKPISDGMIGSFARIHAVHQALCETGPYVTIRLNRFDSVSLEDLQHHGLAPQEILAYLSAIARGGNTLLIAGEVGTGKTTLARALAANISDHEAILVIEDTPEIRLEHPNVRYITTRCSNTDGAGRVSPAECIRAGMRMAMNRIIFGEIRDAEAAEAFIDVCASGHPGLSTIHARSAIEAVSRLQLFLGRSQRGVDPRVLNEQISTAIQVIVHLGICPETGKRRVLEVKEIGPVADSVLRQRDIFRYQAQAGLATWKLINRVSAHKDLLKSDKAGISLNTLPATLELDLDLVYKEAAGRAL